jgi:Do/DeqQ family serine protease
MKQYLLIAISSLLSAVLAVVAYRYFDPPKEVIIRETVSARYTNFDQLDVSKQRLFLSASPTDFSNAAERVIPAVVNIKTIQGGGGFDLWGSPSVGSASGSGVIISNDGYIVTNNHVIEDSDEIEVTLNDKREYRAELIGTDPSTDLALIKVNAKGLPALEFGNSDSLRVGEWVLAIGNPFNLESTVTSGIVSAKGRSIDILEGQDRIESFIQTDAAVNPGNSGGALVNTNGELIGINTAIITRSGRYEGYSFAVPINLVRKVVRDLRDYGLVQRGILGVFIDEMTNEMAKRLNLDAVEGVYINRVTPESGADDAGLEKGDVIIGVNGVKTKTLPEMQEQLGRYRPGNAVNIEIIREGTRQQIKVILKNKSNSTALVTAKNEDILLDLGFELRELTREERRRLEVDGVKVISIYRGSRVERTNMDPGFVITKIDNRPIGEVEDLVGYLERSSGKIMLEGIYEGYSGEYYYAFPLD